MQLREIGLTRETGKTRNRVREGRRVSERKISGGKVPLFRRYRESKIEAIVKET